MSTTYYKWEEVPYTWSGLTMLWSEVYYIVNDITDNGNYNLGIDVRQVEQNIQNITIDKKKKLINVLIMLGEDRFTQEKEQADKLKITINDIKTISNKYLRVELK